MHPARGSSIHSPDEAPYLLNLLTCSRLLGRGGGGFWRRGQAWQGVVPRGQFTSAGVRLGPG